MSPQPQLLIASARRHRQAQEHLHAFAELIRAVTVQPLSAELAREVVVFGRSAGTSVAAAAALEDSLENCEPPARAVILRLLARALRRPGRLSKARPPLYQLLGLDPGDVRVQIELARALYVEGRHRELAELLRVQSIAQEPRHRLGFRAGLVRGHLLLQELGEPVAASQAFSAAAQAVGLSTLEVAMAASLAAVASSLAGGAAGPQVAPRLRRAAEAAVAEALDLWPQAPTGSPEAFLQWIPKVVHRGGHRTELWVVQEVLVRLDGKPDRIASLQTLLAGGRQWAELAHLHVRLAERGATPSQSAEHLETAGRIRAENLGDPEAAADLYRRAFVIHGGVESLDRSIELLDGLGRTRADQQLDQMVSQVITVQQKGACLGLRARRRFRGHLYLEAAADLDRLAALRPLEPFERALWLSSRAELGDHEALHQLSKELGTYSFPEGERITLTSRVRRLSSWLCPEAHGPGDLQRLGLEATSDPGAREQPQEVSAPTRRSAERRRKPPDPPKMLLEEVEQHPLRAHLHRKVAEALEEAGSILSATIHREVARALDGDPFAHPLTPKNTLTPIELAALKHPVLNGNVHEVLALCGEALCAITSRGSPQGAPFEASKGKGERVAEAMLSTVRILGIPAPALQSASLAGPPFGLVNTDPISIAVGRVATSGNLADAELRFYAARALFSATPGFAPLRLLTSAQLTEGLESVIEAVMYSQKSRTPTSSLLAERLSEKARTRVIEILEEMAEIPVDWSPMIAAARHSANRAGLVVAGGVAAAVDALRTKGARRDEVGELIRFAISTRYLRIRERR